MDALTPLPFLPGAAGIDEAGRGPLAGPLVVAGVVLPENFDSWGIADSKALSARRREGAYIRILSEAKVAVEIVDPEEIDRVNILQATLQAMARVAERLEADRVRVDGNQRPPIQEAEVELIVQGDAMDAAIAAASIVAKVTRDRLMLDADAQYPEYGFRHHFGYASRDHLDALQRLGPCPIHRRSFEPVRSMINQPSLSL
jgi:ribonuclease HII